MVKVSPEGESEGAGKEKASKARSILQHGVAALDAKVREGLLLEDAEEGNLGSVKDLLLAGTTLECYDSEERSPLHKAALEGHVEVLQALLSTAKERGCLKKSLLDGLDQWGNTPLFCACTKTHFRRHNSSYKCTKLLVDYGATCSTKKKTTGMTPLHWAAYHGQIDLVKLLLEQPDINSTEKNRDGIRAIGIAGDVLCRKVLEETDVDYGDSALPTEDRGESADTYNQVVSAFLMHGTNNLQSLVKGNKSYVAELLYWASFVGDQLRLEMILESSGDSKLAIRPNFAAQDQNAIHAAATMGHTKCLIALFQFSQRAIAKWSRAGLVAESSSHKSRKRSMAKQPSPTQVSQLLGTVDLRGNTPLHLAVIRANTEMLGADENTVRFLLENNADGSIRNKDGLRPIDYAQRQAVLDIMRTLDKGLDDETEVKHRCSWVFVFDIAHETQYLKIKRLLEDIGLTVWLAHGIPLFKKPIWEWRRKDKGIVYMMIGASRNVINDLAEKNKYLAKLLDDHDRKAFEIDEIDKFEPLRSRDIQEIIILSFKGLFDLDAYLSSKVILRIMPTHNLEEQKLIHEEWNQKSWWIRLKNTLGDYLHESSRIQYSAVTHIKFYFGEKVGMYFAWMQHYIAFLFLAAIPGLALFIVQVTDEFNLQHPLTTVYSCFMAIWATLYCESWKRKQTELAYNWDMHDFELQETTRPEFEGDETVSPVTGQVEKYYSPQARKYKYYTSIPVIFTMIGCAISAFLGLRLYRHQHLEDSSINGLMHQSIAGAATGLSINLLNFLYQYLARWFTNWENHRTNSAYENSLIIKTFCFQFVNSNAAVMWAAFYERSPKRTFVQVAGVMLTKQGIDIFKEMLLPRYMVLWRRSRFLVTLARMLPDDYPLWTKKIYSKLRLPFKSAAKQGGDGTKLHREHLGQWEDSMAEWNGLTDDYAEMVIQYGQITMYSGMFPLAPVFALLNNMYEIKAEVNQYMHTVKRPRSSGASNIGAWLPVMEFLSICGVLANCLIIYFMHIEVDVKAQDLPTAPGAENEVEQYVTVSSQILQFFGAPYDGISQLWFILIVEHVLVGLKLFLAAIISDSPAWVREKLAKDKFIADKRAEMGGRMLELSKRRQRAETYKRFQSRTDMGTMNVGLEKVSENQDPPNPASSNKPAIAKTPRSPVASDQSSELCIEDL